MGYQDNLRIVVNANVGSAIKAMQQLQAEVIGTANRIKTLSQPSTAVAKQFTELGTKASSGISLVGQAVSKSMAEAGGKLGAEKFLAPLKETDIKDLMDRNVAATKAWENAMSKSLNQMTAKTKQFSQTNFAMGFALLFIGMQIKRFAATAIMSISKTYKEATGEQSEFNQKTNELAAAWEFFKFSLIDALMSTGLFTLLVNFVVNLLNKFAKLPESVRIMIILTLAALFVASAIAMIVGQLALASMAGSGFALSILAIVIVVLLVVAAVVWLSEIWSNENDTMAQKIFKTIIVVFLLIAAIVLVAVAFGWISVSVAMTIMTIVAVIMLVALAVLGIWMVWNNASLSIGEKIFYIIGILALLVFAIAAVAFGVILWPVLIVAVIAIIIGLIISFRKAIWELIKGLWESIKYLFIGGLAWLATWLAELVLLWQIAWKKIGGLIVGIIFDALIWVAKQIDKTINGIIKMINKIPGVNINVRSNVAEVLGGIKDKAVGFFDTEKQIKQLETVRKIRENAAKMMSKGVGMAGDAFKQFGSDVKERTAEIKAGFQSKQDGLMGAFKKPEVGPQDQSDNLGMNSVFGQFATQQGKQTAEQEKSNDLLGQILGVNQDQLTSQIKAEDLQIDLGGGESMGFDEFYSQYNGSTTNN